MSLLSLLRDSSGPGAAVELTARYVSAATLEHRGGTPIVSAHAAEALPAGALVPSLTAPNVQNRQAVVAALGRVLDADRPAQARRAGRARCGGQGVARAVRASAGARGRPRAAGALAGAEDGAVPDRGRAGQLRAGHQGRLGARRRRRHGPGVRRLARAPGHDRRVRGAVRRRGRARRRRRSDDLQRDQRRARRHAGGGRRRGRLARGERGAGRRLDRHPERPAPDLLQEPRGRPPGQPRRSLPSGADVLRRSPRGRRVHAGVPDRRGRRGTASRRRRRADSAHAAGAPEDDHRTGRSASRRRPHRPDRRCAGIARGAHTARRPDAAEPGTPHDPHQPLHAAVLQRAHRPAVPDRVFARGRRGHGVQRHARRALLAQRHAAQRAGGPRRGTRRGAAEIGRAPAGDASIPSRSSSRRSKRGRPTTSSTAGRFPGRRSSTCSSPRCPTTCGSRRSDRRSRRARSS